MKRIISIQDLSCIGKCSQGVALPVLSAMGIECAVLPTALLSTHTAFDGFVSRDLTDCIRPILAHWKTMGLCFDAIYSGYLASEAQIDLVEEIFDDFGRAGNLFFVDPVMADNGSLYPGFSAAFPGKMRELCRLADIITPNVTEACLLTGLEYRTSHDEAFVRALLEGLLTLGAKTAIVTGIRTDTSHMGVAAMGTDGKLTLHYTDYIPAVFYGTGDLFASTCAGALTLGLPASDAISLAADQVVRTIRATTADPEAAWYGVNFEQTLPDLSARLREYLLKEEAK